MKTFLKHHYVWPILRIVLGALFIIASLYKIHSPDSFADVIYNYRLLPNDLINPVAIFLPWVQFFAGLALVIGHGKKGAAFIIFIMMIAFQAGLASALIRGLSISCGCFEGASGTATWLTFLRDTVIFGLATAVLWKETRPEAQGLWMRI